MLCGDIFSGMVLTDSGQREEKGGESRQARKPEAK
jgi:hypothetical protein